MALTAARINARLLTASQPGHAVELGYDALGRLLSEEGPLGAVLSEYRADGARTRLTHPGSRSFEMLYRHDGAIRAIHENDAAGYRLGLFHYDVENRLIDIMPNAAPGRTIQRFTYDPPSRLASIEHDLPSAGNDLTIGLGYNAAGQIATRTRSDADYVFDEPIAGETGYDRNGLNQYPAVDAPDTGAATLTYDARGNFLRYNAPGDDHERIYVYDQLNRLISARLEGESVAEATLFSYDPFGRLYQVTDQASGVSRRYLWDGDTIIAQYAGTSGTTVQRRWVYAPGSLGAPLVQYWNAQVNESSRQYISTDERGSVTSLTNPGGSIATINSYDPYGRRGAGNEGQFGFAGQLWLPEAELYYMRNRMYDPELGRFTQVDPIGYAGGINLYGYARNDPTNMTDPLGLEGRLTCEPPITGTRIRCQRDGASTVGSFPGPGAGGNRAAAARGGSGAGSGGGATGTTAGISYFSTAGACPVAACVYGQRSDYIHWGSWTDALGGLDGRWDVPQETAEEELVVTGQRPQVQTSGPPTSPSGFFLASSVVQSSASEENCATAVDIAAAGLLITFGTTHGGEAARVLRNAVGLNALKAGVIGSAVGLSTFGGLSILYYYNRDELVGLICENR